MISARNWAILIPMVVGAVQAQQISPKGPADFLGRKVTIQEAKLDADGFFPLGPSSICLEGPPKRQCYTPPKEYGRYPSFKIIEYAKNKTAILFSVATGGVSGWAVKLALLEPGERDDLEDLLPYVIVSNQSEYKFLNEPSISSALIFVTADATWGPSEAHYGPHRFIVSSYILEGTWPRPIDQDGYALEDRYMTLGKYENYEPDKKTTVLDAEKSQILTRLGRVKAEALREAGRTK